MAAVIETYANSWQRPLRPQGAVRNQISRRQKLDQVESSRCYVGGLRDGLDFVVHAWSLALSFRLSEVDQIR